MRAKRFLAGALASLMVAACASPAPRVEQNIGTAVNTAKALQTINPDASQNTDPVAGIDGTAAANTMGEYHSSFKTPPPTFPVINIGVGGGGR
jgi:hypothetical protein